MNRDGLVNLIRKVVNACRRKVMPGRTYRTIVMGASVIMMVKSRCDNGSDKKKQEDKRQSSRPMKVVVSSARICHLRAKPKLFYCPVLSFLCQGAVCERQNLSTAFSSKETGMRYLPASRRPSSRIGEQLPNPFSISDRAYRTSHLRHVMKPSSARYPSLEV